MAFTYSRKLLKPWTFLTLTFTWSWLFLVIAVLLKQPADALPIVILSILSGIILTLVAILYLMINFTDKFFSLSQRVVIL